MILEEFKIKQILQLFQLEVDKINSVDINNILVTKMNPKVVKKHMLLLVLFPVI